MILVALMFVLAAFLPRKPFSQSQPLPAPLP
jgi:hypothetical protein